GARMRNAGDAVARIPARIVAIRRTGAHAIATARRDGGAGARGSAIRGRRIGIRRTATTAPTHAPESTAAVSGPRGTSTAASGSAAAVSTITRSANAMAYAASANGLARSVETAPAAMVATLVAMSAGNNGTAMRF